MPSLRAPERQRLEVFAGVVVGVAAAAIALAIDQVVQPPFTISAANARGLLAATFGALVTAGAFSFWMLPLAAQLAASSVPPPTVSARLRDPFQRRVIAASLGALTFTAIAVLSLPAAPDAGAPAATTLLAGLLGVAGIAALLVAIQHAVRATQPSNLVSQAATAVVELIDRAAARDHLAPHGDDPDPVRDGTEVTVLAPATGWMQDVDHRAVLRGVPAGTTVFLEVGIGSFVVQDWTPIGTVRGPDLDDRSAVSEEVRRHVTIADARGPELDLVSSITRFTDIAVHAASGASGSPSIVYESLWHLGAILHALTGRDLSVADREHADDRRFEWQRQPDAASLATIAVDRIRQVIASDPSMALELVRVVMDARQDAVDAGHDELVAVMEEQADLIVAQCRHADPLPADLDRVVAARCAVDGGEQAPARDDEYPTDADHDDHPVSA